MIRFTREVQLMKLLHSFYVRGDVDGFVSLLEKIGWKPITRKTEDHVALQHYESGINVVVDIFPKNFEIYVYDEKLYSLEERVWNYLFFIEIPFCLELEKEVKKNNIKELDVVFYLRKRFLCHFGLDENRNNVLGSSPLNLIYTFSIKEPITLYRTKNMNYSLVREEAYKYFTSLPGVAEEIEEYMQEIKSNSGR